MRTWKVEAAVALAVLSAVAFVSGNHPVEWLGVGAVWLSFMHGQVADRMVEAQARAVKPEVHCWRWARVYFAGKELLWVAYFVIHHSYSALVGCALFLLYPAWRRYWRARQRIEGKMSWQIRMIEAPTFTVGPDGKNGFQRIEIGDAWFAPHLLDPEHAASASERLSPNYHRDWAGKRPPIIVALPWRGGPGIGSHFCVDGSFWRNGEPYGDGWIVTGEAPLLTLSPSVDIKGSYHGFIQNGVIGPDLGG